MLGLTVDVDSDKVFVGECELVSVGSGVLETSNDNAIESLQLP